MDVAELLSHPHDMNVGDAAHYLEGFAAEMASVGYSPLTIGGYLDSVIHFGGWLQARGLSLTAIDEKIVKAFGAHRCKCRGRRSYQPFPAPISHESNGLYGISDSKASSS